MLLVDPEPPGLHPSLSQRHEKLIVVVQWRQEEESLCPPPAPRGSSSLSTCILICVYVDRRHCVGSSASIYGGTAFGGETKIAGLLEGPHKSAFTYSSLGGIDQSERTLSLAPHWPVEHFVPRTGKPKIKLCCTLTHDRKTRFCC